MKNTLVLLSFVLLGFNTHAVEIANSKAQIIEIKATENGFEPAEVNAQTGSPITLQITRTTDSTCATEVVMKEKKINTKLPLNKKTNIELGVLTKGDYKFSCAMNMLKGVVHVK